jgi:hypothetical protein
VESVYSAVRTESLYKTDTLLLLRVNQKKPQGTEREGHKSGKIFVFDELTIMPRRRV